MGLIDPLLQHNMWVADARSAVLSIVTGGGKWGRAHRAGGSDVPAPAADRREEVLALRGERGGAPAVRGRATPTRLEAVRIVDMSASNSWAEFAATFRRTRPAYQEHESAKADLKKLVPEDAREAIGHGLRAKRSKSGALSFEVMDMEAAHAPLQ